MSYEIKKYSNKDIRTLTCGNISIMVNVSYGMNVESIVYKNVELIDYNTERRDNGATYGTPILYPTPNRIRDGHFTFEGNKVKGIMHGVVRFEKFTVIKTVCTEKESIITASLQFDKNAPFFEHFPYESELTITIAVTKNSVQWRYLIENMTDSNLPYSFALHPFWKLYENAKLCVFSDSLMDMDADKLPTGNYKEVEGTDFDLNQWQTVTSIDLDHVYRTTQSEQARIMYQKENIGVSIITDTQFKHCVVFTPKGQNFFCVEPQTSSTDAHNMHTRGFAEGAQLKIIPPRASQGGLVTFIFSGEKYEKNSEK